MAWRQSHRWTQWHVGHIGLPLCGTPVPDKPQAQHERAAEIRDWPHICKDCKALAIKAATRGEPLNIHELIFTER